MAKRRVSPTQQRDMEQALAEADLRFGRERSALATMIGELEGQAKEGVRQASQGATMIRDSAKQAVPQLQRSYGLAGAQQSEVQKLLDADLKAAGPAAGSFKLAANIGAGGARSRLAESMGNASRELISRQADAVQGGVQEGRAVQDRYRSDVAKVLGQLGANEKEAGLFAQTRYGQLRGEAADRGIKRTELRVNARDKAADNAREDARLNETVRHNTASENKAGKDKAGKKWAAPASQAAAKDKISEALSHAKEMKAAGRTRSEIAQALLQGRSPQTIKDDKGNPVPVKGRPKIPELYLTAALDMTFGGGLHPNTIKKLHDRKIKVKPLGYPTYRPGGQGPNPNLAPGANGQRRPN